jgi:hypothetical protein
LQDLEAGGAQAKCKYVLIAAHRMALREAGNVRGIVQIPIPVSSDEARIVLLETFQASTARGGDMCLPICPPKLSLFIRLNADSAVNDRYQVSIRHKVKNASPPWTIHAAEKNIAIKRCTESFLFSNTPFHLLNLKVIRRCAFLEATS